MNSLGLTLVLSSVVAFVSAQCDLPPSQWCSSRKAAQLCRVERQCELSGFLSPDQAPGPVNFTLYYESLCPDCQNFFRTQLFKAYQKIGQIMNITLVPYGNAFEKREGDHWKYNCQHGPEECVGNLIDVCTIYYEKTISSYLPFIHCMEMSSALPATAAKQCATQFPVALDKIMACANSSLGNQLEHEAAVKTDGLSPPHQYVPWVTVNGVHTEKMEQEAEQNLIKLICDHYQGVKPSGCQEGERETRCWNKRY